MRQEYLWLAVHGLSIGTVAFSLLIASSFVAVTMVVRRVLVARDARRLRSQLGEPRCEAFSQLAASHQAGAPITLVGRLVGSGARATCPGDPHGAAAATLAADPDEVSTYARAERLWLEVDGERVELAGRVRVVVGDHEVYPPPPGRRSAEPRVVAVRQLDDGQIVWARGVLSRAPTGTCDGTYRAPAPSHWVLAPPLEGQCGREGWIALAAVRTPNVSGNPWPRSAAWFALGTGGAAVLFSGALLWAAGALGMAAADETGSLGAAAVAAITPFHRSQAIDRLTGALEGALATDVRSVQPYLDLSRLQGREHHAFHELVAAGRLDQAGVLAYEIHHGTGIREVASRQARLGQLHHSSFWFERARELDRGPHLPGWREEALVHLLAGRVRPAAELTAIEARLDRGHRRCIADAMAARAGDDAAFVRLAERAGTTSDLPECTLLWADLVPPEARVTALDRCDECASNPRWTRLTALLRYEALQATGCAGARCEAAAQEAAELLGALFDARGEPATLRLETPALERALLEALSGRQDLTPPERRLRARLALSVGLFDLLSGEPAVALRRAQAALADTEASAELDAAGADGVSRLHGDALALMGLVSLSPGLGGALDPAWPADVSPASALVDVETWPSPWDDPVAAMAELSPLAERLEAVGDPRARFVRGAVDAYRQGLGLRDTAVLIDVFGAW